MTDVEFLENNKWRKIGQKRLRNSGIVHCWVPDADSPAAEDTRGWWTQGDALSEQRRIDRGGTRARDNKTSQDDLNSL